MTASVSWCWNIPHSATQVLHRIGAAVKHVGLWVTIFLTTTAHPFIKCELRSCHLMQMQRANHSFFQTASEGVQIPHTSTTLSPVHPLWVFLIATDFRLAANGWDKTVLLVVKVGCGVQEQLQSQDKQKLEDAGLPRSQTDTTKSNARKDNWREPSNCYLMQWEQNSRILAIFGSS